MKLNYVMMSTVLASISLNAPSTASAAQTIQPPKLISIQSDYIFAPPGFDNNDNAQIVISGLLPSTCYKTVQPAVRVDHSSHRIYISAMAYVYTGCFCLAVMTPFSHTVDLGVMSAGAYQIFEVNGDGKNTPRGALPIATTRTAQPDENLYAPVKSAIVEKNGNQAVVHLSGVFSSDCIDLQRVVTLHRASRIIEILPLATQKPGVPCTPHNRPFEARVAVGAAEAGENLIHIRSMNGNSVNLVEEF
ncbi:MAG: hypothetical protein ACJ763_15820 [Bdellovibrionia bacterium]